MSDEEQVERWWHYLLLPHPYLCHREVVRILTEQAPFAQSGYLTTSLWFPRATLWIGREPSTWPGFWFQNSVLQEMVLFWYLDLGKPSVLEEYHLLQPAAALQQVHCNNYTATIGLQLWLCKNCTELITLHQLNCSNFTSHSTATIALQQFYCNICVASVELQQFHCTLDCTVYF